MRINSSKCFIPETCKIRTNQTKWESNSSKCVHPDQTRRNGNQTVQNVFINPETCKKHETCFSIVATCDYQPQCSNVLTEGSPKVVFLYYSLQDCVCVWGLYYKETKNKIKIRVRQGTRPSSHRCVRPKSPFLCNIYITLSQL